MLTSSRAGKTEQLTSVSPTISCAESTNIGPRPYPGFTSRYNITRLVWFEIYDDPISAITREKELKKWKRRWKVELIEARNPRWDDLYESICNQGWSYRSGPEDRTRIPGFGAPVASLRAESRDCGFALHPPRNDTVRGATKP